MKTVPLSKQYVIGSLAFSEAVFRAPMLKDYRELGQPVVSGQGMVVRDRDTIFAYIDRLVTSPAAAPLQEIELVDALALEEAVLDFFVEARKLLRKPGNSSSGSAGSPATSTGSTSPA